MFNIVNIDLRSFGGKPTTNKAYERMAMDRDCPNVFMSDRENREEAQKIELSETLKLMRERTMNNQITSQLEGRIDVTVHFNNAVKDKEVRTTKISLYNQDGRYWVKHCLDSLRIEKDVYDKIVRQFTHEQEFNTDPEVIRTDDNYLSFLEFLGWITK